MLGAIWKYFSSSNASQGAPIQSIHLRFGKGNVKTDVKVLPPGAIYIDQNQYRLSLLGFLLMYPEGPKAEQFLVDYLEYVRAAALKNPDLKIVKSDELIEAFGFSETEILLLGQAIFLGGFWSGTASLGGPRWNAGMPNDIDELPFIEDFREYIARNALEGAARVAVSAVADLVQLPKSDFWFVSDAALRKQLQVDRQEMLRVQNVNAWKCCVILCGGILEGMLVDVLRRDIEEARAALIRSGKRPPNDFDQWRLVDLVDAAHAIGILPKGAIHLGHALREFRNLIHPVRQEREGLQLTSDEAEVAARAVDICFRALASQTERLGAERRSRP